ncbi:MAG: ABC transporter permease, partial [bacterium]
ALWLLRLLVDRENANSLLGDIEEDYRKICATSGVLRADYWCWAQVIFTIPAFFEQNIYWSAAMLGNYLKITFRNLVKYKSYSLINILGLALGMACCILIFLWVQDELSYDRFHKKADRIYRVESELQFANGPTIWPIAPALLAPAWRQDFPEVENAVRMHHRPKILVRNGENTFYETRFFFH